MTVPRRLEDGGAGSRRLALALVLALAAALAWREETALDFGVHLATGRYVLEHRALPAGVPFTYTVPDRPYIDHGALMQVAFALAERAGGMAGVGCLRVALILTATGVLWAHARRRGARSPALLLAGFTLGLLAWELRFFARPELATFLLLGLELELLRRHAASGRARWLYAIAPLELVWAFSHTLALIGPAVLGLYALASLTTGRRRAGAPWIALALTLGAALLHPSGPRGLAFLWQLRTRLAAANTFAGSIGELRSPFSAGTSSFLPVVAFKALLVLGAAAVLLARPRLETFDLALVAGSAALAASALRNIGLFVVAGLPVLLGAAQGALDRLPRRRRFPGAAFALAAFLALAALAGAVTGSYYLRDRRPVRFGSGLAAGAYPIRTADYAIDHQLGGPIYNHLNFGGYLVGRLWPREKVYIVPRVEVMGDAFFAEYLSTVNAGPGFAEMVRRRDPNLAFVPNTAFRLLAELDRDPEWCLAEVDGVAALFVRVRPRNAAIVEAARASLAELDRPAGPGEPPIAPRRDPHLLRRWLAPRRFPWEALGRGNTFFALGRYEAARREYGRALAESGRDERPLALNYAAACYHVGRRDEARAWYRRLLALEPGNRLARERLAELGDRP